MKSVFLIPLTIIAFIGCVAFYGALNIASNNFAIPVVPSDTTSSTLPLLVAGTAE